ncbi:YcnI family protein [Solihabitans fulvus]|uniref:YcnI family protein n=1 Tax=Solihabitans fulvus TaxID=1892852 RepID=A0A5B2XKS6_9PSEU|nr:YcnI family protein [Solihabitans fulvus]KAA2263715.1 YcnI family protein [Solihabitans fulvus]
MSTNRFGARTLVRGGAVLAVAGIAALLAAGTASAHVTAQPGEATKGGYAKITLRVPNERPNNGTVKLQVNLPADHPLASVSTKPVPGWKAEITKGKLDKPVKVHNTDVTEAVRSVTWTADAGVRIEPGQFNEFDMSVGPLPDDTDRLVLPTTQTYDNGEVVVWDAPPVADGAAEPAHPAPTVKLVDKAAGGDSHSHDAAAPAGDSHDASTGTDKTARWLGGAGLAVGALGLGFGAGAVLRSRRTGAAAPAADREPSA